MSSKKYGESGYNLDLELEVCRHPLSIDLVLFIFFMRLLRFNCLVTIVEGSNLD